MASNETRQCHIHTGLNLSNGESCPLCLADWEARKNPGTMTPEERMAEMARIAGPMQIPFEKIHERIEELVGRPVLTHEMALGWEYLVQEAGNRVHPSMDSILNLVPEEKRIVIVTPAKEPEP